MLEKKATGDKKNIYSGMSEFKIFRPLGVS